MLPHLNILHLSRREDRMQQLLRQMEWNKVPYIIHEGIDNPNNVKESITIGHKRMVQYAKDNDLPFINCAEDDILFSTQHSYKYFNEQAPKDIDLFFGVVYHGTVNEQGRVLDGMSGIMTMYRCYKRFYDQFLEQADTDHIDRGLGNFCHKYKFYVCKPQVCFQSGGMSDQLKRVMYYWPYMDGKEFLGHENQKCENGIWVDK